GRRRPRPAAGGAGRRRGLGAAQPERTQRPLSTGRPRPAVRRAARGRRPLRPVGAFFPPRGCRIMSVLGDPPPPRHDAALPRTDLLGEDLFMRLAPRACLCLAAALAVAPAARADGKVSVDYQRDVLPIFQARCYKCHDARKQTSAYRLDVRSRALRGGESGKAAVVPGDSAKSELSRRVTTAEGTEAMPPGKEKLTPAEVKRLRDWVDAGAPWPDALANEGKGGHWAFQPPKRPALPPVKDAGRARNAIDHFVLARLEKEGLKPSPEADKVTLLRRVTLDLTGLPPTVEEVDAFFADKSAQAYEKAVERLLASPHYGE